MSGIREKARKLLEEAEVINREIVEVGERIENKLKDEMTDSEVQTGKEIIKQLKEGLSKLKEGYISDLTVAVEWTIDELEGKAIVSTERWAEVQEHIEKFPMTKEFAEATQRFYGVDKGISEIKLGEIWKWKNELVRLLEAE